MKMYATFANRGKSHTDAAVEEAETAENVCDISK
jgi:hypothetical protein